jgi:hypothetical protein
MDQTAEHAQNLTADTSIVITRVPQETTSTLSSTVSNEDALSAVDSSVSFFHLKKTHLF